MSDDTLGVIHPDYLDLPCPLPPLPGFENTLPTLYLPDPPAFASIPREWYDHLSNHVPLNDLVDCQWCSQGYEQYMEYVRDWKLREPTYPQAVAGYRNGNGVHP